MLTLQLCIGIFSTLFGTYFVLIGLGKFSFTKGDAPKKNLFYVILGVTLIVLSLIRLYSAYLKMRS